MSCARAGLAQADQRPQVLSDHQTATVRMNEAEVAFDLMMEVRNKLLDAYRDVMKMQP